MARGFLAFMRCAEALLLLGALAACRGGGGPGPTPVGPDTGAPPLGDTLAVSDAENLRLDASLTLRTLRAPADPPPVFDWSALTTDFLGVPIDPVAEGALAAFASLPDLSPEQIAAALASDTLPQDEIALYTVCTPAAARCSMGDFTVFGNDIGVPSYFASFTGPWLLVLASRRPNGTLRFRHTVVVEHDPAAAVGTLALRSDDATLRVQTDLDARPALPARSGTAALTVDWAALRTDVRGRPIEARLMDRLEVGRFDGLSRADLAARFGQVESLVDARWTWDIAGAQSIALDAPTLDGTTFPGFTPGATWALTLSCSTCLSPVPLAFVLVEPRP